VLKPENPPFGPKHDIQLFAQKPIPRRESQQQKLVHANHRQNLPNRNIEAKTKQIKESPLQDRVPQIRNRLVIVKSPGKHKFLFFVAKIEFT
jgi:PleD family two-component response regulator